MSVSSTSAAAQGEGAPTEVEKAERRVAALEAKEEELREEKRELRKKEQKLEVLVSVVYHARRDRTPLTDDIKGQLVAITIVNHDSLDDVLAKLVKKVESVEESLTSANTQIETAQADLAAARKQALEAVLYIPEELFKLLSRYTGDEETYSKAILGREEAEARLKKALDAPRLSGRWGVITTVGVPGSGKTFFLRAGILRKWYPRNSIMMTYYEGAKILDDGKMKLTTAFARQLVQSNCVERKDINFDRISDLDTVIRAFRLLLGLDKSETLIVCVDELMRLRTSLVDRKVMNHDDAHMRCRELRSALMAYQDDCTKTDKPAIRFVWTSLTEHFETTLEQTGSKREIHPIPLASLTEEDAWDLLGDDLKQRAGSDAKDAHILRWGFHLCAGNPRGLADGLSAYNELLRECAPASTVGFALPREVVNKILQACRINKGNVDVVTKHFAAVIAGKLGDKDKDKLLTEGYLLHVAHGTLCFQPALVRLWATHDALDKTVTRELAAKYFNPDRFVEAKVFEEQTYLFEQLLNCAYEELKLKPTLKEYFGDAFVHNPLRDWHVHPRTLPVPSVLEPSSLETEIETVKQSLKNGATVYSSNAKEKGIDVLIPLQLAEKAGHEPTMNIFCGQNKLVEDHVNNLGEVEKKMNEAIAELELGKLVLHELYFTTHSPELATANRTGVWFTRASLEKWLSRMGMPQCTQNSSPPTKSVLRSWAPARWNPVRAPAVQQAWLPRRLPLGVTPRGTVNALLLRRARCAAKLFA